MPEIEINGKIYQYIVARKNVKNVNLRIGRDKIIKISSPKFVSIDRIENIIRQDSKFIENAVEKIEQAETAEKNRSEFYYLGKRLKVEIIKSDAVRCELSGDVFKIYYPKEDAALFELEPVTDRWLLNMAKKLYSEINREVYEDFLSHGYNVPFSVIQIKKMKTRWGSCTWAKGRISMNLNLMHYKKECIYSVFYHEYMHYFYHNHSKEFYSALRAIFPLYDKYHKELS